MVPMSARWAGISLATALLLSGCGSGSEPGMPTPADSGFGITHPAATSPTQAPALSPSPTPPTARAFDADAVVSTIEALAALGPREATGEAYARASELVEAAFGGHGYRVSRQEFAVPAGTSWGVRVPAGRTWNVIADPPGFDPNRPHVVIGAHLDTVPQSPGAEDNSSGVAVALELARMIAEEPAEVPVRFIVFGAEEPRGPGDERHHHGSRHYVAELDDAGRSAIVAMVSLDRVGVRSDVVPIAHGGRGTDRIARQLADAAPAEVAVRLGSNTTSDHWSFEKAGIPAARIGSVPYAGYHSRDDEPSVIDHAQLGRVGAVMWAWLRALRA